MARYAEECYAWDTKVEPFKSEGEIKRFLSEKLKADEIIVAWSREKGKLIVQFTYNKQLYSIIYSPLVPRYNSATNREKAYRQMFRRALNHLKIIVDLAEGGNEEVLMPYQPMLGPGSPTLQKTGMKGLEEMLRNAALAALPPPTANETPEFIEIKE